MADLDTADDLDMLEWARAERFDDFALMCCRKPHLSLLSDPDQFSVTQRAGRMGPVLLSEILVGSDLSMACGDMCDAYRVLVLVTGHTECVHRGVSVSAGPGSAAVYVSARRDGKRAAGSCASRSTGVPSTTLSVMHSAGR